MKRSNKLILVLVVFAVCLSVDVRPQETVYRVGNSLTWDSQPKAIEQMAAQRGIEQVQAYHIACGKVLEWIWNHPDDVCVDPVSPYGTFKSALPEHEWDAITIQPYRPLPEHPEASTLTSDTERFLDLIDLARSEGHNGETTFYLYCGWPARSSGPYKSSWQSSLPDSTPITTQLTRAYFRRLLKRVRARTGASIGVIPVGEVLYELDRRARAGEIPGHDSATDFYRDRVHLTNVGRFAAALTTLAVTSKRKPDGLTKPKNQFGKSDPFTPEVYDAMYEAVSNGIENFPGEDVRVEK